MAISVDIPSDSVPWAQEKAFTFPILSDPTQAVIHDKFHIRNPESPELAIHAIYIVDESGTVIYRKIGRRRPGPQEVIDALDFHRGRYVRPAP